MEPNPVNGHDQRLRAAMIALMVWVSIVSWSAFATAQEADPSSARDSSAGLKLPARPGAAEADSSRSKSSGLSQSLLTSSLTLGIIVVAVLAAGHWMKRNGFGVTPSLPADAFELLGKRSVDQRNSIHLARCGSRLLLLSVSAEGIRTLSEIDDPAEVNRITSACQQSSRAETTNLETDADTASKNSATTVDSSRASKRSRLFAGLFTIFILLATVTPAWAQPARKGDPANVAARKDEDFIRDEKIRDEKRPRKANVRQMAFDDDGPLSIDPQQFLSPQQMGMSLKVLILMTVISLVPSILMMTTCFVRFTVVLGLLRQALGTPQGPPNQVMTAICLFLTILVMAPVWQKSYQEGIRPYTNPPMGEPAIDETTALARTVAPVRSFMSQQIEKAGNAEIVWLLHDYQNQGSKGASASQPESYEDISLAVLTPAYMLSELKVGFLIGFQLFLPFLVIDLVVGAVLTSLGMMTLPPTMVSLPLKLLLFVLIDGWFLTVGMLLESVKVA